MGDLENKNKKKTRRRDLQHAVLNAVKMTGVLGATLLAPNVVGVLHKFGITPKPRHKEYISSSASKLVKRGLLRFEKGHYVLTAGGERCLRRWDLEDYKIKPQKRWDNKWRVIIFDIPEKKRKIRNSITSLFHKSGLVRLQDSVWVYPYDCEDIIGLLKTDYGVGKYLLYMIVDELENDRYLREEFNLGS